MQKPSQKFKRLKKYFSGNKRHIRTVSVYVILLIFVFSGMTWLSIHNEEEATKEIQSTLIRYHYFLDQQDYESARTLLIDGKINDSYIQNVESKAKGIAMKHIWLKKAYPALVYNNLAVVAFLTEEENAFKGNVSRFDSLSIFFFAKEYGQWKIATPMNLKAYNASLLVSMLNDYRDFLKENAVIPEDVLTSINPDLAGLQNRK